MRLFNECFGLIATRSQFSARVMFSIDRGALTLKKFSSLDSFHGNIGVNIIAARTHLCKPRDTSSLPFSSISRMMKLSLSLKYPNCVPLVGIDCLRC
jgi:hypothetical protein